MDVLIIDEMGKDISGCGFDANVVGRIGMPLISKEPETPRVKRIVVCDLNALYVNAIAAVALLFL